MCVISPSDQIEPITLASLIEAADATHRAALAFSKLADQVANEGSTGASIHTHGSKGVLTALRRVEEAHIKWRALHHNLLADTTGTHADERHLSDALEAALHRNALAINRTAMHRADTAEAADAALTARQCARGADLVDNIPAYGNTETAPCADLTRTVDTHDYGKSAAANASASRGAYERGFGSLSVA